MPGTGKRKKLAVLFTRWGPYHVARLRATTARLAQENCEVVAIEITRTDRVYAWTPVTGKLPSRALTLFDGCNYESVDPTAVVHAVRTCLQAEKPDAVALPGWFRAESLAGLDWCRQAAAPAILMSESARRDGPRSWVREQIKRLIVSRFSSALVGGSRHAAYAAELGVPPQSIYSGYDAVDNEHFCTGAERARVDRTALRQRFRLPERYLLASGRFIRKKNLPRLVEAYAAARRSVADPWDLVICGDGPCRPDIEQAIASARIEGSVHLPGFVQYEDLPVFYGLAAAFIHPSTMEQWGLVVNEAMASGLPVFVAEPCGCAPELVHKGVNGYTFDPADVEAMAGLMRSAFNLEFDLPAMGKASLERVASWGPERFAAGLASALGTAFQAGPSKDTLPGKWVLNRLLRTPPTANVE